MTDNESSCIEACVQVHVTDANNTMTTYIWWIDPDEVDDMSASITERVGEMPECSMLDGNLVMAEAQVIWDSSIQLATE